MFTINQVITSVLCLAKEDSLQGVTKTVPVYLGHAHSTVIMSLPVVDEVQTLGQLCAIGSPVKICKPCWSHQPHLISASI